jgi:O-antigen/teichoic acid export membrane protein
VQETIAIQPEAAAPAPSPTAGMTTKVVKGSLWTLVGQVLPLAVSLVTTPFVIRMLGAENYGVLILVGLIPTYLGFADFGMSIASTKFASEAYAVGDTRREASIVRTAALIALCSSLPIALVMFALSSQIISLFNVPEASRSTASLALKFAAVTFVLNFLNGIFNTPQLTRLRMDLNTLVNAGFRILGLVATPFAVYMYGILGAVFVLMVASLFTLLGHLAISNRLDKHLFEFTIDRSVIKPMVKFGSAVVGLGIAGALLLNAEKGILASTVSAKALAFYSVAFTLASMMILLSTTMIQSLVPAFSQLLQPHNTKRLELLFARIVRLSLIILIPAAAFLCMGARDLIRLWAGAEFSREGAAPLYILLFGLLFSVPGYVPYSLLMSAGRANVISKLYWLELIPYLLLVFIMTAKLGIIGAAIAWSTRVAFDGIVFFLLAKRSTDADLRVFRNETYWILAGMLAYLPAIAIATLAEPFVIGLAIIAFVLATLVYAFIVWRFSLLPEEQKWFRANIVRTVSPA